jgi:GT2 family glycosyltransferase
MQLSIIIVNYNVKYFLEQCLCSVKKAIKEIESEVVVIDNGSGDKSIEYLQEEFSFVKFIIINKNEGFSKANNIALHRCMGEYVLFLNPDTIIAEDILQHCLNFFSTHKEAGAVGVRMIDGSGNFLPESKRSFPSIAVSFFKLSGLSYLLPHSKFFNRYALGHLSENEVHEVDVLCGAFLMVKRNVQLELNGFDESFFMYGEDIDLCYRIQKSGYKNFYLGNKTIIHFKGESAKQSSFNYVRIFYSAMSVFVKKHYRGGNAWLMNVLLHAGIYARASVSLLASPFQRREKVSSYLNTGKKFLLVGDPVSSTEAESIIKQNIEAAEIKKLQSLRSVCELQEIFDEVIFCAGNFLYKESIQFIDETKNKYNYKWHGLYTKSIVGSSDKEFTGEVYKQRIQ